MPTAPLNTSVSVTLDGSGNGTAQYRVNVGQRVDLAVAAIITSTANLIPQCSIYIGGAAIPANLIDGTYIGSLNSTSRVSGHPLTNGQSVFAVWSGGDPGAVATLSLFGTLTTGQGT